MSDNSNRYDQRRHYEEPSRYEEEIIPPGAPPPPRPAQVLANTEPAWPARGAPEIAVYRPILGEGWSSRKKARKLDQALVLGTQLSNRTERFYSAARQTEEALQALEHTTQQRALIPMKIQQEKLAIGQQILQGASDFEMARADHQRHQILAEQDFEIARLRREVEKRELAAKIAAADAQLALAPEIGRRWGEAELRRADHEASRFGATKGREPPSEGRRRSVRAERLRKRTSRSRLGDICRRSRRYAATQTTRPSRRSRYVIGQHGRAANSPSKKLN